MSTSICIDATHYATAQPTGVEKYVDFLLPLLSKKLSEKGVAVSWVGHATTAPQGMPQEVTWIFSPYRKGWGQIALTKLLATAKPDLYFTPSGLPPLRYTGKVAFTVHDMAVYLDPGAFSLSQRIRLQAVARQAAKKAAMLITPSRYTSALVEKFWRIPSSRLQVAHSGFTVSPSTLEPVEVPLDVPLILYVSRIETKKNILTVIEGFVRLLQESPAQLVLAGKDGYGAEKIRKYIGTLPIEVQKRIHLLGYISEGQKQWLYRQATISVIPCMTEGFGLPVLESFSQGVPAICAQSGALPEIAGDAVLYAQGDSPVDWYLHMQALLNDPELQEHCRELGKKYLEQFTWERAAEQTAQALLSVIT